MGKSKHYRRSNSSSSSSSSSSSDREFYRNPEKLQKKRMKMERKMRKKNRCVCGMCPHGMLACPDNFMKAYPSFGSGGMGYSPGNPMAYGHPHGHHGSSQGGMMGSAMLQPGGGPMGPSFYGKPQQPGGAFGPPGGSYGQPGMMPGQPGMMLGQPGMMPGQPGMMHGQPGMMPGQPGMMPGQPGMMPGQPGMMPGQPGMMHGQPGMMPGQPGMGSGQPGFPPMPNQPAAPGYPPPYL